MKDCILFLIRRSAVRQCIEFFSLWGQVTPSSSFQKDLGLDSLDTVEVVMAFEEEFAVEIPDSEADKILSTADAINYIAAHPQAK